MVQIEEAQQLSTAVQDARLPSVPKDLSQVVPVAEKFAIMRIGEAHEASMSRLVDMYNDYKSFMSEKVEEISMEQFDVSAPRPPRPRSPAPPHYTLPLPSRVTARPPSERQVDELFEDIQKHRQKLVRKVETTKQQVVQHREEIEERRRREAEEEAALEAELRLHLGGGADENVAAADAAPAGGPESAPPPPLRTNRTRRVLQPVLIGHAVSLNTGGSPRSSFCGSRCGC
jgi:hypothetical protein